MWVTFKQDTLLFDSKDPLFSGFQLLQWAGVEQRKREKANICVVPQ